MYYDFCQAIIDRSGSCTPITRQNPSGTARVRQAVAARTVAGLVRMRPGQVLRLGPANHLDCINPWNYNRSIMNPMVCSGVWTNFIYLYIYNLI